MRSLRIPIEPAPVLYEEGAAKGPFTGCYTLSSTLSDPNGLTEKWINYAGAVFSAVVSGDSGDALTYFEATRVSAAARIDGLSVE